MSWGETKYLENYMYKITRGDKRFIASNLEQSDVIIDFGYKSIGGSTKSRVGTFTPHIGGYLTLMGTSAFSNTGSYLDIRNSKGVSVKTLNIPADYSTVSTQFEVTANEPYSLYYVSATGTSSTFFSVDNIKIYGKIVERSFYEYTIG